jgi:hypothetical protein
MLEFYKQKMNDESLDAGERAVYAEMYEKMASKEEAAKLKAEIETQRQKDLAAAEKEDEGCEGGGCKI